MKHNKKFSHISGVLPLRKEIEETRNLISDCLVQLSENREQKTLVECPNGAKYLSVTLNFKIGDLKVKRIALRFSESFLRYLDQVHSQDFWKTDEYRKAQHIVSMLYEPICLVWGDLTKLDHLIPSLAWTILMQWDMVVCGRWDKEVKYHTNFFFCRYTKTEPPVDIGSFHKPGTLFLGGLSRYLSRLMLKRDDRVWTFLCSVLQGVKKGMPPLGVGRVNESALKHVNALGTKKETPDWLLREVTRTAREIWQGKVEVERPKVSAKVSRNACLERFKRDEGPLGACKEYWLKGTPVDSKLLESEKVEVTTPRFGSFYERILVRMDYSHLLGITWEVYTDVPMDEVIRELRCCAAGPVDWMGTSLEEVLDRLKHMPRFLGESRSMVKFILEPLKVRTITKASLFSNAIYPELQKQLWTGLQAFKQFELTGMPICQEHLDYISWSGWRKFGGVYDLCSGDYSAATDNLHMDCTEAALKGACSDPNTFELLYENLCNQEIDYEGAFGKGFEPPGKIRQQNGQLMGSMYSFPILCCVNLAVYRACYEQFFEREVGIAELPVFVNGDDILFPTNVDFQRIWEATISLVGFEKSVGKNFVSSEFYMINSKMFRYQGEKRVVQKGKFTYITHSERKYEYVPFINCSFLSGIKKGEALKDDKDITRNDKLHLLKGGFRDAIIGLERSIADRMIARICERTDVRDSKYSRYDLGLEQDIPTLPEELRKFYFHNLWAVKFQRPLTKLSPTPFIQPDVMALERAKLEREHWDISRMWKKFIGKELHPTRFSICRELVSKSLGNRKVRMAKALFEGKRPFRACK